MPQNKTNELTAKQEGNKFVLKRVIEDELDAEEYLRNMTNLENNLNAGREQMKKLEKDLNMFKELKGTAQEIRLKEIEEAKKQREKLMNAKKEKN